MKKLLPYACCALLATILSCSKDDQSTFATSFVEENPYPLFIQEAGYNQQFAYIDDNNHYEVGFSFKPTVNGKINALVVQLPDAHSNLRVTIWDKATAEVIRTENVNIPTANTDITLPINPLQLEKNKEYLITINSDDYFMHSNANYELPVYPIVAGNIIITGSRGAMSNSGQMMPDADIVNITFGDCSFNFEPIE